MRKGFGQAVWSRGMVKGFGEGRKVKDLVKVWSRVRSRVWLRVWSRGLVKGYGQGVW